MAECNPDVCLSVPFPKKCAEYCMERVLSVARPEEKRSVLGMEDDLAEAIFSAYNTGSSINSFDDLRNKLTPQQIDAIKSIFNNLDQSQLNHFLPKMR